MFPAPPCPPEQKVKIRKEALSQLATVVLSIGIIRILPVLLESVGAADMN